MRKSQPPLSLYTLVAVVGRRVVTYGSTMPAEVFEIANSKRGALEQARCVDERTRMPLARQNTGCDLLEVLALKARISKSHRRIFGSEER